MVHVFCRETKFDILYVFYSIPLLGRCRFNTTLYYYNLTRVVLQLRRGHQLLGRAGSGLTQQVT